MRGAVSKLWDKLWGSRSDAWLDASPSSEARDCRPPGIAGKWLRRLLAGVVLLAVAFASAYAVYRWQQPRWPGLPAEPELLDSITAGCPNPVNTYEGAFPDLWCASQERCSYTLDCSSPDAVGGMPCGSCIGWRNGRCISLADNPSGQKCEQWRRDECCCPLRKTCQTIAGKNRDDPDATYLECLPVDCDIWVGTWYECFGRVPPGDPGPN